MNPWSFRARHVVTCMTVMLAGCATPRPSSLPDVDAALPAWQPAPVSVPAGARYVTRAGAIRVGGAEHVKYIVERFDALFAKTHPGITFDNQAKGTTSSLPLVTYDVILFGPVGRGINPVEQKAYHDANGGEPLELRVAHASNDTSQHLATSLAVYVNRANPVERLSEQQVAKMLSVGNPGGDYSRWGQVGLGGVWAQRAIHPYDTPEHTGFGDYLQTNHLDHRRLAPSSEQYGDTGSILKRLEADPAGIAVAAIGRATDKIKAVPIVSANGAATTGTPAEIVGNVYPYGRFLYFYLRRMPGQPLDPLAVEYMRMVLSRDGQQIIASQTKGYMPLTAEEVRVELAKLK